MKGHPWYAYVILALAVAFIITCHILVWVL
jgi:hypothetical protein